MGGKVVRHQVVEGRRGAARKQDQRRLDDHRGVELARLERQAALGQPRVRHGGHQGFDQQPAIGETARQGAAGGDDDARMTLALQQGCDLNLAGGLAQGDLHLGIKGRIAPDQGRQDAVVGGADKGELQAAGLPVPQPPGDVGQGGQFGQGRADMDQKLRPKRRQGDAALGAGEQGRAQLPLQGLDRLAERRLGHVQPCGRPTEMQGLGHGFEVSELTDIHLSYLQRPKSGGKVYFRLRLPSAIEA